MTDEFIFEILKKFNSSEIVSLELNRNGSSINLKKAEGVVNNSVVTTSALPISKPMSNSQINIAKTNSMNQIGSDEIELDEKKVVETKVSSEVIKSPIVGTFYRSPSPDAPPFAEVGKKISKGEPLCILEAMKMMNTLESEYDCEIVKILVNNGELVEFDQPIFEVKKI